MDPRRYVKDLVVGEAVRELREAAGMSTPELAEKIGVTGFHLSQGEEGRNSFLLSEIVAMSEIIDLNIQRLYRTPSFDGGDAKAPFRVVR